MSSFSNQYFALDLHDLEAAISCIPLHEKIDLSPSILDQVCQDEDKSICFPIYLSTLEPIPLISCWENLPSFGEQIRFAFATYFEKELASPTFPFRTILDSSCHWVPSCLIQTPHFHCRRPFLWKDWLRKPKCILRCTREVITLMIRQI